eukprot:gene9145-9313_t
MTSQSSAPGSDDAAITAVGSAVARVAEAWAAGVAGAVGVSDSLMQQDVVTAIEGLAADATQANIRLAGLEGGAQQQQARLEQLEGHNQQLSKQLHQADTAAQSSSPSDLPSPAMPSKLQHAFEELQEKLTGLQASAAAGQAEVIHEALQHLHSRLVSIEEAVHLMSEQQFICAKQPPVPAYDKEQQLEATLRHYMPDSNAAAADLTSQLAASAQFAAVPRTGDACCPVSIVDPTKAQQAAATSDLTSSTRSSISSMDAASAGPDVVQPGSDYLEKGVHTCSNPAAAAAVCLQAPSVAAGKPLGGTSCIGTAAMPVAEGSFDLLERQVAEIQQEVTSHQLQTMQEVTEDLTKQVQTLTLRVEQQQSCLESVLAALPPLEPQVTTLTGQVAVLQAMATQHPRELQVVHQQIEQLSLQLSQVNASAADDEELDEISSLSQQLTQQVDTMAQILAESGSARAEQAETTDQLQHSLAAVTSAQQALESEYACLKEKLTREVQELIQQSDENLASTCAAVRQQLSATARQLSEHDAAIGGCAKSAALAGVVATVRNLPGAIESLGGRIDEVAQAQRAAEGQLNAGQEQQLVLQGQLVALQSQLEVVASSLVSQKEELFADLQKLQVELLQPTALQLRALQEQESHLAQLQSRQAALIEELGSGMEGWKTQMMANLARDRQQLAQAIDELQAVVEGRCIKTDQLGEIFAARDNMYGAWQRMQAVFEANRSSSEAGGSALGNMLFKDMSSEDEAAVCLKARADAAQPMLAAGPAANSTTADLAAALNSQEVATSVDEVNAGQQLTQSRLHEEELSELRGRVLRLEKEVQTFMATIDAAASAAAVVNEQQPAAGALQTLVEQVAQMQKQHIVLAQQIEQQQSNPTLAALEAEVHQLHQQFTVTQEGHHSSTALSALLCEVQEQQDVLQQQVLALQHHSSPIAQQAPAEKECDADEESEDEFHSPRTNVSFSAAPAISAGSGGVLHAPLSLVVQLQQEVAAVRDGQVSKEQFAVLARMIKDMRGPGSQGGCASPARTADGIAGPSSAAGTYAVTANCSGSAAASADAFLLTLAGSLMACTTPQEVQQHSDALQAMERNVQILIKERLQTHENVTALQLVIEEMQAKQQQALGTSNQQLSELSHKVGQAADRHAAAEQQLSTVSARCTEIEPIVQQLLVQHAALHADMSSLTHAINDLTAKVAMTASAPKQQWQSADPVTGGFNELVTALAKLKGCYDQQAAKMGDLQDQEQQLWVMQHMEHLQLRSSAEERGPHKAADVPLPTPAVGASDPPAVEAVMPGTKMVPADAAKVATAIASGDEEATPSTTLNAVESAVKELGERVRTLEVQAATANPGTAAVASEAPPTTTGRNANSRRGGNEPACAEDLGSGVVPGALHPSLSFSDLSLTQSDNALAKQLWSTATAEVAGGHMNDLNASNSSWFENVFDAVDEQQAEQQHSAVPGQEGSMINRGSEDCPAGVVASEGTSSAEAAAPADGCAVATQETLAAQLFLMEPVQQVAFLSKLTAVVSAHAARLLTTGEAYAGEYGQRLSALETKLSSGLKVLAGLRTRLAPLQEVADATQSMLRELQVAHGLVLQRLEGLEGLAATVTGEAGPAAGGGNTSPEGDLQGATSTRHASLAVAGSVRALKGDVLELSRRLSAAEAKLSTTTECLSLSRRVDMRLADTDARAATLSGKVSGIAGTLPVLLDKVSDLEGRLTRTITIARRGLDILADQLVALGALNGRSTPTKNPLAALGPNHAAITALEGKVEAVRTAMTASVKLMMQDLAQDATVADTKAAAASGGSADVKAKILSMQLTAAEAATAAAASHADALDVSTDEWQTIHITA